MLSVDKDGGMIPVAYDLYVGYRPCVCLFGEELGSNVDGLLGQMFGFGCLWDGGSKMVW